MRASAALGALACAIAVAACGSSTGSAPSAGGAASSSHTLAASTYFNPVPACSTLGSAQLQGLLGGAVPSSARSGTGDQGDLRSCTWTGGPGASSKVLLSLDMGVPAIECRLTEPAPGVAVIPGVGNIAYYQEGQLTAWNKGLWVQLRVASPAPPPQLPALMSAAVNGVFARMGAI